MREWKEIVWNIFIFLNESGNMNIIRLNSISGINCPFFLNLSNTLCTSKENSPHLDETTNPHNVATKVKKYLVLNVWKKDSSNEVAIPNHFGKVVGAMN